MNKNQPVSLALPHRFLYRFIQIILLLLGIVLFIKLSPQLKINDFIEYWSSSRLITHGQNPYDPASLLQVQRMAGLQASQPIMYYLPPWAFTFIIPFSMLSFFSAQVLWLLFNICLLLVCINISWKIYGGENKYIWMAWLIAITFAPTYIALGLTGQISFLMLAGITGFINFIHKPKMAWLAGVFVTLISIKPQVTYLFLLAIFIWGVSQKKWGFLSSFIITLAIESGLAIVLNHAIFAQYVHLMLTGAPAEWASPTLGSVIRLIFGYPHTWLQYIPLVPGIIWLAVFMVKNKEFNWVLYSPIILFMSIITTAYAWTYDQVILIGSILYAIILLKNTGMKLIKWYIITYILINIVAWILRAFLYDFWFFWLAPSLFLWYLGSQRISRTQASPQ
jgi:hypothetical protein